MSDYTGYLIGYIIACIIAIIWMHLDYVYNWKGGWGTSEPTAALDSAEWTAFENKMCEAQMKLAKSYENIMRTW